MEFSEYKYRVELHCHTKPCSSCAELLPCEVIERYKVHNVDTIAITNHFTPARLERGRDAISEYFDDFYRTAELGKKAGINVVLGMEIRFSENWNDYLVFGIDEDFVKASYDYLDGTIEKFYTEMKNDKNVIIQAHPFRDNMEPIKPEFVDGIETFNMHINHNSRVARANMYAKDYDRFILTTGSDYHHIGHEATGITLFKENPKDSFDLARLLKEKDYLFSLGGCVATPYLKG